MKIFGIAGWSGSGKTTLLTRLIPVLVGKGISVATIKHTHHDPQVRGQVAGAVESVMASAERFALIHDLHGGTEPGLDSLLARLGPVDLVLVEGFKYGGHPRLEVWDPGLGKDLLAISDAGMVAVASDAVVPPIDRPVFGRDDTDKLAAFILDYCELGRG